MTPIARTSNLKANWASKGLHPIGEIAKSPKLRMGKNSDGTSVAGKSNVYLHNFITSFACWFVTSIMRPTSSACFNSVVQLPRYGIFDMASRLFCGSSASSGSSSCLRILWFLSKRSTELSRIFRFKVQIIAR